jgi:cation diffusion facilitator CzcD-associated flavoprotein CzcO
MLHLLRRNGFSVQGFERGGDVGGTWYWNRYPGCRCDVESMEYSYQFSNDLQQEWEWSERYSSQPEILSYANHVADRYQLRDHIQFNAGVTAATYDAARKQWEVEINGKDTAVANFLIMATGCLSAANTPDFPGLGEFAGRTFHTGAWPHDGVDFGGRRVGVVGTGSSGIQSIPLIASDAAHLTVFQRTPNYSVPARNAPLDETYVANIKSTYDDFRARNKAVHPAFGADFPRHADSALEATPEARERRFEEHWRYGGFAFLSSFSDVGIDVDANWHAAEFVRNKIRSIVKDPQTAQRLCPDTVIGCKRLCADSGYYETYNRNNVTLVDVRKDPIEQITPHGLVTAGDKYELDDIVFATGFDAMTGALLRANIRGVDGVELKDTWSAGPRTYMGLMTVGFPNLFTMTGPGSPSVLANMITGVEHHAEFITELLQWMETQRRGVVQANQDAQNDWVELVNMRSSATLFPRCNSWYLGANIPGKPRVFMPYIGFPDYCQQLDAIRDAGYKGLSFG